MYNWSRFITAIIQHIYECKLQCILIMIIYMAIAFSGVSYIYTHIALHTYTAHLSFPLLLLITPLDAPFHLLGTLQL